MRRYLYISIIGTIGVLAPVEVDAGSPGQVRWQTAAQWHRLLAKPVPGTLSIDDEGIRFLSTKFSQRWPFVEIHTFDLTTQDLTLWTYERRHWHEPGERPFHFTLSEAMPPEVAAQLLKRVERPVRSGIALPDTHVLSEIPAHRRTRSGGSNGMLRVREDGIDYITERNDSWSWRWRDIQTIANPNPYELRITGYREIVEFDLKQPLPRELFERLWDRLYAADLNLSPTAESSVSANEGGERR